MNLGTETIRSLDLFAGAGGLTEGLHSADGRFTTVRAVESDPAAAATFDANHGQGVTFAGGIEDWLSSEDVPQVDLVVGGPPCQGFSSLNRARVGAERNRLWEKYADTIVRAQPKWFVLENVSNFRKSPEYLKLERETQPGGALSDWCIESQVLLAADYGSAQLRRRTVVIGHHRDVVAPEWPKKTRDRTTYRTVAEALDGLTPSVVQTDLPDRWVVGDDRERPGAFTTNELHLTRFYTDLSLLRFGHIPLGGNRFDLPDDLKSPCWLKHTSGSGDVMGRLHWDRPSVTIRTEFFKPEKGRYLHPTEHRALTHHEAARLQGFPDDYLWVGNKLEIARQMGNAVPIELGKAIGASIAACSSLRDRSKAA
ncbi:MAG TPA: DNA cytosine methyltransferase [Microlunatus sp.]